MNQNTSLKKMQAIIGGVNDMRTAYEKLEGELRKGPASYYFSKLEVMLTGLFSFAKFQIGDRVKLAADIDAKGGWYHCAHFLKKGEMATVVDMDYDERGFSYNVVFDNETWIDRDGVKQPVANKHSFGLYERHLETA